MSHAFADDPGTYQFGPAQGRVEIRTSRIGLAARAGHDLLLEVPRWQARVEIPEGGVAGATISAELDLGSLTVREGTGGARPLSAGDRGDITKTMRAMLGDGTATFTSTRVVPSNVGGAIEGTVTFRGKTQPVHLQVREPSPGHYRGTGTVSQTGFGITPYTGFFGALKVRDEVTLEFDLSRPDRRSA
jgi:hypothetical protein